MNDQKYAQIEADRAKGMSWAQIAPQYKTNPRALGKAFSVARLARGGAPLRKDKPNRSRNTKPAKPLSVISENGPPNLSIQIKALIGEQITEAEQAIARADRLTEALALLEGTA